MSGVILQIAWPIGDNTLSMPELIEEAADTLPEYEAEHQATITGPGIWSRMHSSRVPGWRSYGGWVLIGRFPADPEPDCFRWRPLVDADNGRILLALDGQLSYKQLTGPERDQVVAILRDRGKGAAEIGRLLHAKATTIQRRYQRANTAARAAAEAPPAELAVAS